MFIVYAQWVKRRVKLGISNIAYVEISYIGHVQFVREENKKKNDIKPESPLAQAILNGGLEKTSTKSPNKK